MKTINIWMGGLYSPPTLRDIKIAFNTSIYISTIYKHDKIKLYMVPTNKYYLNPLTKCVSEKNRVEMLKLLLNYTKSIFKINKNIDIKVSESDLVFGKKYKSPPTVLESIKPFNKSSLFFKIFHLENVVSLVKGDWDDYTDFGFKKEDGLSLKIIFTGKIIVVPTFSNTEELTEKKKINYIYKNINLPKLLNNKKEIPDVLKNKTDKQIKQLILKQLLVLPDKFVPKNLKTISSKKVIQELENFYTSLDKINELSSSSVTKYIIKHNLYKNCYSVNKTLKKKKSNTNYTRKNK